eukprot:snap_masked-scaffold_2-processed-gene-25.9-mRNA-1 protein AED:1.00 eAED:1.00 QI:0/0/0/0/1/1/3/0/321
MSIRKVTKLINQLTSYAPVQIAKERVVKADQNFLEIRKVLKDKNVEYNNILQENSALQQQINSLLQRKQQWTSSEVDLFTDLCQKEIKLQDKTNMIKNGYLEAENNLDTFHTQYIDALRNHYNEEQIWTEKSRKLSIYFSSGLFVANSFLLLISLLWFEPLKRERIVESVSRKLQKQLEVGLEERGEQYKNLVEDIQRIGKETRIEVEKGLNLTKHKENRDIQPELTETQTIDYTTQEKYIHQDIHNRRNSISFIEISDISLFFLLFRSFTPFGILVPLCSFSLFLSTLSLVLDCSKDETFTLSLQQELFVFIGCILRNND